MELRIGISARVEIGPRLEIRIHGYRWGRRIGVLGRKRNRGRKLIFSRLVRIDRRALNERIKAEIQFTFDWFGSRTSWRCSEAIFVQ